MGLLVNILSDLPIDVQELVYQQLNWEDRLQFSIVCKSWKTIHNILNTQPWVMSYFQDSTFKFRGPPLSKPYTIKIDDDKIQSFSDVNILASKQGWLLAAKNCGKKIFCYNPFTSKIFWLLDSFDFGVGPKPRGTFSAPVNSSDCVIFFIECGESISISLYLPVSKSWEKHDFENDGLVDCKDVTYTEKEVYTEKQFSIVKEFYCVFNNGVLGIFELGSRNWRTVRPFFPTILQEPSLQDQLYLIIQGKDIKYMPKKKIVFQQFHLVESGGEIFMVCSGSDFYPFKFFKLDRKKEKEAWSWIEVRNLRNRAIFLNDGSCSISIFTKLPEFSNKMFYFPRQSAFVWSFCLDAYEHKPKPKPEALHKLCDKFYGSDFEPGAKKIWIDPPN